MKIVPCSVPSGSIESAPLTSLPLGLGGVETRVDAFWAEDDSYLVRLDEPMGALWFRVEAESTAEEAQPLSAERCTRELAEVTPIGGGRVLFPVGSTGRTVFRVWRASGAERTGRTRILGVRAGRSRRRQA